MRRLRFCPLVLVVAVTTGCALRGNTRPDLSDWAQVTTLAQGTDVVVEHTPADPRGARAVRGRLLRAGDSEVVLQTSSADVSIARDDVRLVAVVTSPGASPKHGTFIGGVIGAAYALLVTSRAGGQVSDGTAASIGVLSTGAGAAAGAWADGMFEGRNARLIYRRR